jgi:hypothetical protein
VLADARAAEERCRGFWGEPSAGLSPIRIFLCDSHGAYLQLSFGGGGNACCAGSSLLLYPAGVGKQNLAAVICHEMSHAFLRQHVGNWQAFNVPVWLDEGIATYLGETTWASAKALRTQLETMPSPEIVSMQSLTSRSAWLEAALRDPDAVPRLYASARSFVEYLVAMWDERRLFRLVNQSLLEKVDDAFASVYKARLDEVEQDWLAREIEAGHVPRKTRLVQCSPGLLTEIRFYLPYAVILFGAFWGIRQCFAFGRFLLRLAGQSVRHRD